MSVDRLQGSLIYKYNNRLLLLFANCTIFLLFVPYFYWGDEIYARVFDNLDSNVVWARMLLDSGNALTLGKTIDQMMYNQPHHAVYGVYDFSLILFSIFGSFWGYVVCKILMAYIAFWGMYLLLIRYIINSFSNLWVSFAIVSTCCLFAILPFWSFNIGIAALPFVFFAFFNLRNGNKSYYNWLILVVYAFWSSLVISGYVVLLLWGLIWLYDLVTKRYKTSYLFLGLVTLTGCYIISHLPYFYGHFGVKMTTIRSEFASGQTVSLANTFKTYILPLFLDGDSDISRHSVSMHHFLLIPIALTSILMVKEKVYKKSFILPLIFIVISSFYFGLHQSTIFQPVRMFLWNIFPMNFTRFFWLNAFFWYLIFAISICYLIKRYKWGVYVSLFFIVVQFFVLIFQQDYIYYKKTEPMKYGDFYAEKQFKDIGHFINRDQSSYRIANIGIEPAVALYNGFYTIDGFSVDYTIEYKRKFRKIIEGELARSQNLTNFFDNWGVRCYLLVEECIPSNVTERVRLDRQLMFNYDAMKDLGAEYIISANEIDLNQNKELRLLKVFDKSDYTQAFWTIYLYEVL